MGGLTALLQVSPHTKLYNLDRNTEASLGGLTALPQVSPRANIYRRDQHLVDVVGAAGEAGGQEDLPSEGINAASVGGPLTLDKHQNDKGLEGIKRIMRYNNYKHDPVRRLCSLHHVFCLRHIRVIT